MSQDLAADMAAIREWLAKESYLPQDFDDMMIKKFLHSCYGSLERTKKCIERFCTTRSNMPEVYTCRDPTSDKMKDAFSITNVSTYLAGDNELLIHQLNDPELEKFNYYDVLKSFAIQADYWLKVHEVFPEGHIIILDIKDYTLKILPKINVLFFKDFLLFLLEGMPVRVKGVHVINCPSYYEMLYGLVKPVLPADIRSLIQFHGTPEGVHKHIDPKYIPEEYGGSASSMTEQHNSWVRDIQKNRAMFLDDAMWKANLAKKPKGKIIESAMNGSFRALSID